LGARALLADEHAARGPLQRADAGDRQIGEAAALAADRAGEQRLGACLEQPVAVLAGELERAGGVLARLGVAAPGERLGAAEAGTRRPQQKPPRFLELAREL